MRKFISFSILFLAVAALWSCGPTEPTMTNDDVERDVKARLEADPQLNNFDIEVDADTSKKQIELSGTVTSNEAKSHAVDTAKKVHADYTVKDSIKVEVPKPKDPAMMTREEFDQTYADKQRMMAKEHGDTLGSDMGDAWIHMKIVSKLIAEWKTPERKINVDVMNNKVTLRGDVETAEQKAMAEKIAKDTEGVTGVKNELKVVPKKG